MPFRPSCIICCSDCDTDGLFTSCQHFLCVRCTTRYPPGQCPRCRKPCRAIKAGPALPRDIADRMAHDPQRLLLLASQGLDFQRRQEQQTIGRLRELVATLNQSNRTMVSQVSAAKVEREKLLATIKQLQEDLLAQQRQQKHHREMPQVGSQGPCDTTAHVSSFQPRMATNFADGRGAMHGWLSSPAPGAVSANSVMPVASGCVATLPVGVVTPLGWGQPKRSREDGPQGPSSVCDPTRFCLATPAITLRNALHGSRDDTPQLRGECAPSRPLQSLLCRPP
ncbi:hypothetical protein ERJ75_001002800 [Trypanosoma vivax]|uniref:RING-type domain-containing protein n=1 Tax=Trypanosoma vivax (strain Y486) TaxID=1055687 RepID=G0UAZ7_TRYVY|nr:hypothetical protein TRVL_06022 [Trypanosoma vivax]KAH8611115.1 hypothetical protein ERJ75_001002800 [Trypanosoma vivax]CCC52984.1 conserved hypothetical protein [Trypanosoma vivax Y486]